MFLFLDADVRLVYTLQVAADLKCCVSCFTSHNILVLAADQGAASFPG